MFQERQTTHFATITAASNVTFTKDKEGCVWAKITTSTGHVLSINLGIKPTAIIAPHQTHTKSGVKITMAEDPTVGETYLVDIEIPEYCDYSDRSVFHMTGSAYAKYAIKSNVYYYIAECFKSMNIHMAVTYAMPYGLVEVLAAYTNTSSQASELAVAAFRGEYSATGRYVAGDVVFAPSTDTTNANKAYIITTAITTDTAWTDATKFVIEGVIVREAEQDWQRGFIEQKFVDIRADKVRFAPIKKLGTNYYDWGTVEDSNSGTISMTKTLADMEYQHIANRMDIYMNSTPQFRAKIVDACGIDTSTNYDTMRIQGTYHGNGHAVQDNYFELIIAASEASSHDIMEASGTGVKALFVAQTSSDSVDDQIS